MTNQYLDLFQSKQLLTLPNVNILMLPARRDDWTLEALNIAKAIPTAQVYVGHRGGEMTEDTNYYNLENLVKLQLENNSDLNSNTLNIPVLYNHQNTLEFPKQTQLTKKSKFGLFLQKSKEIFSDNSALDRIHAFGFDISHRSSLPFPEQFFDLTISQTPQASDVMHVMSYGTSNVSNQLFKVMKTDSFWIHFNSGFRTIEYAKPYFEQRNELNLEKLNNELLNNIHKGGHFLRPEDIKRVNSNPMLGKVVGNTGNNCELYQRRKEYIKSDEKLELHTEKNNNKNKSTSQTDSKSKQTQSNNNDSVNSTTRNNNDTTSYSTIFTSFD
jgi:hypothetical protein